MGATGYPVGLDYAACLPGRAARGGDRGRCAAAVVVPEPRRQALEGGPLTLPAEVLRPWRGPAREGQH
jgi:hypothetical protein